MNNTKSSKAELDLSIVIPVYNSADTLNLLIDRLTASLRNLGKSYEIILVNDGSRDNSWRTLQALQNTFPDKITVIELMRNFGQHNAIMCGLKQSSGNLVVTLDDDLQNPPEEIGALIQKIESEDLDLVYGMYRTKQHAWFRNLGSSLTQIFYRFVFKVNNGVSAFRIMRRPLVNCLFSYNLNYTYIDGLLAWNTTRIGEIEVQHDSRTEGESGYSFKRLLLLALNLFTNFSLLPLQVVSILGFLVAIAGFSVGAFYAYAHLVNNIEVPGFASLIIAILTLGGIQMISLGILGEYLGRLHINANQKPQYVEREKLVRSEVPIIQANDIPNTLEKREDQ